MKAIWEEARQVSHLTNLVVARFELKSMVKKLWCCVGGEYNKIIWFYQLG